MNVAQQVAKAAWQSETEKQKLENEYSHFRVYSFSDLHRFTIKHWYALGSILFLFSICWLQACIT